MTSGFNGYWLSIERKSCYVDERRQGRQDSTYGASSEFIVSDLWIYLRPVTHHTPGQEDHNSSIYITYLLCLIAHKTHLFFPQKSQEMTLHCMISGFSIQTVISRKSMPKCKPPDIHAHVNKVIIGFTPQNHYSKATNIYNRS